MKITSPFNAEAARRLHAGDTVLLSGIIYTARDAAHKRLIDLLDHGKELPFDMRDSVIYYVGPTPAGPGKVIGSAGPTSSYRMDSYCTRLIDLGMRGMIGKGLRSADVVAHMQRQGAVYFGAIGGAGALLAKSVVKSDLIAYEDLGSEAIRRLEVRNMPLIVVIDSYGNNLYEIGQHEYLSSLKK